MVNLNTVLNERIARIARKEIKSQTGTTKKATVRYRSDIAALKREVARLRHVVAFLEAQEKKRVAQQPVPQETDGKRFRADGLKSHRAKLGLSARDYGNLVGVAGLTIYQWESGKSRPRQAQLAKLAAVRGIGKREALKRLELLGGSAQSKPRKRGTYKATAQEMIVSLIKSRQATTGTDINAEWRKAGRPGTCDYVLSNMVSAGKLKRTKLKDERGSKYSVA
jgi:DNA-binding transcriptional regulator YiaG